MFRWRALTRSHGLAALLALATVAGGAAVLAGSDHQDMPLVELNPRMDLTDVYAFPGSAPGRIVLVMNTSGFLSPAMTVPAAFDPNIFFQLKAGIKGDPQQGRVIQVSFEGKGPGPRSGGGGPMHRKVHEP